MAKPKQDDPEQSRRFIEMAQDQGGKLDQKDLGRAVKKLAPHVRKEPTAKKR